MEQDARGLQGEGGSRKSSELLVIRGMQIGTGWLQSGEVGLSPSDPNGGKGKTMTSIEVILCIRTLCIRHVMSETMHNCSGR